MYAVRDLLLRLKNPQTKRVYFDYLEKRDALDASAGLVYIRGIYRLWNIY